MLRKGLETLPVYKPFQKLYDNDISNLRGKLGELEGLEDEQSNTARAKLDAGLQVAILKKELSINYWNLLMGTIQPPGSRIRYGELIGMLKQLIDHYNQALAVINNELNIGVDQIKQILASVLEPRMYEGTMVKRVSQRGNEIKNESGLQNSLSQKFLV